MLELLDEYERYAVALVDQQKARLLTVYMGEIEESDVFHDPVPGKAPKAGASQARAERHHDALVLWHLKRVVEHLTELLGRRPFDRLILAGPEEAMRCGAARCRHSWSPTVRTQAAASVRAADGWRPAR